MLALLAFAAMCGAPLSLPASEEERRKPERPPARPPELPEAAPEGAEAEPGLLTREQARRASAGRAETRQAGEEG